MRTKNNPFVYGVIVILTVMLSVACSVSDSPVSQKSPEVPDVSGVWWAYYDSQGTCSLPYTHVGQALCLNADGKGYVATFYYDDDKELIGTEGGLHFASFTYNVDENGYISFKMDNDFFSYEDSYLSWMLKYINGSISCTMGSTTFNMLPASDEQRLFLLQQSLITNGSDSNMLKVLKSIENDGERYVVPDYKFTLENEIDKATSSDPDVLKGSGSISLEFRVAPIYLQSANGSKAGDYYFVTCIVTPHNNSLWAPFIGEHGATRNRVYGYWFKEMNLTVDLVNADGSEIEGLSYYERPIPENENDSRSYTNGKTFSIGGSLSVGANEKQGLGGNLGFSIGASWTSSTNYTLSTINCTLDSSSPTVKYHYYTNNVKLKDDWDDMEKNFPNACHSEFTARSYWVWFVPYDKSGKKGVCDGLDKRFRLKASVEAVYSSWYHWRWTVPFDGNRRDYDDAKFDTGEGFLLVQPNRTPWGIVALKNAMSTEMAHVKFYRSGEEDKEPVASLSGSFAKNQVATASLPTGTYTAIFDQMDPDTNKVLSSWILKNIKIESGATEETATTDVSTVDAQEKK